MTRARLLNIAVLAVLLALGVYVARHTYWTEVSVPNPPQKEAAEDEYYATKQLLARFGIHTGRIVSLRRLPSHDQVLFVPDVRDTTLEGHLDALKRWVEDGGRLMLPAGSIWSSGDLQTWTGIAPASHEPPASADKKPRDPCGPLTVRVDGKLTGETLRACSRNSEFAFNSRRVPAWSLANDFGTQMLRIAVGRGRVTILDCECMLRNQSVLKQDHARILFAATPLYRGDGFVFLDPEKAESLLAMTWRLAAPAILAMAATLALLIWRNWPRFGPLEPAAVPVRRSLAEQIRANARFAWRTRQLASLRNVMRRAVERTARKRIAAFSRLDAEQRFGALAARTGLHIDTLHTALEETADGDQLPLSGVTAVLNDRAVLALQNLTARQRVDPSVVDYAVRIARATREWPGIAMGSGSRGPIALVRSAKAAALMDARSFVVPDDIKKFALPVLRHRIALSADAQLDGRRTDDLLRAILETTAAPRV